MYIDIIAKGFLKLLRGCSFSLFGVIAVLGINATTSTRCSNICLFIGLSFEALGSAYILKALAIKGYLANSRRGINLHLTTGSAHYCPYEVNRPVWR